MAETTTIEEKIGILQKALDIEESNYDCLGSNSQILALLRTMTIHIASALAVELPTKEEESDNVIDIPTKRKRVNLEEVHKETRSRVRDILGSTIDALKRTDDEEAAEAICADTVTRVAKMTNLFRTSIGTTEENEVKISNKFVLFKLLLKTLRLLEEKTRTPKRIDQRIARALFGRLAKADANRMLNELSHAMEEFFEATDKDIKSIKERLEDYIDIDLQDSGLPQERYRIRPRYKVATKEDLPEIKGVAYTELIFDEMIDVATMHLQSTELNASIEDIHIAAQKAIGAVQQKAAELKHSIEF